MAKIYPPTDQFRFLSPDEQAARLDAAEDMLALMQFWRGDPRLSSWQEGFLAEMVRRIDLSKGKYKVSPEGTGQVLGNPRPDGRRSIRNGRRGRCLKPDPVSGNVGMSAVA
jgi:hypothetical protein